MKGVLILISIIIFFFVVILLVYYYYSLVIFLVYILADCNFAQLRRRQRDEEILSVSQSSQRTLRGHESVQAQS